MTVLVEMPKGEAMLLSSAAITTWAAEWLQGEVSRGVSVEDAARHFAAAVPVLQSFMAAQFASLDAATIVANARRGAPK